MNGTVLNSNKINFECLIAMTVHNNVTFFHRYLFKFERGSYLLTKDIKYFVYAREVYNFSFCKDT